jgi:hypothetical protein
MKAGFLNRKQKTTKRARASKQSTKSNARARRRATLSAESEEEVRLFGRLRDDVLRCSASPAHRSVLMDGVFKRILEPRAFRRTAFPLADDDGIVGARLPRSLRELIEDRHFRDSLLAAMPRVVAKARSILAGLRSKAEARGEQWHDGTESDLLPAVQQEAFAREAIQVAQRAAREAAARAAVPASPLDEPRAGCAQLAEPLLAGLRGLDSAAAAATAAAATAAAATAAAAPGFETPRGGAFWGCQDAFFGPGWAEAIRDDCARYAARGPMSPLPSGSGESHLQTLLLRDRGAGASRAADRGRGPGQPAACWVDAEGLEQSFPALSQACEALLALPFEINRRLFASAAAGALAAAGGRADANRGDDDRPVDAAEIRKFAAAVPLCACEPSKRSVLLTHFRGGTLGGAGADAQPRRADGGFGDADNGNALSFVYLMPPGRAPDASERDASERDRPARWRVELSGPTPADGESLAVKTDRLVAWRSRRLRSALLPEERPAEQLPASAGDLYTLTLFAPGAERE